MDNFKVLFEKSNNFGKIFFFNKFFFYLSKDMQNGDRYS